MGDDICASQRQRGSYSPAEDTGSMACKEKQARHQEAEARREEQTHRKKHAHRIAVKPEAVTTKAEETYNEKVRKEEEASCEAAMNKVEARYKVEQREEEACCKSAKLDEERNQEVAVQAAWRKVQQLDLERPRHQHYRSDAEREICWNCHKSGHHYTNCFEARGTFCRKCGEYGKTIVTCPRCREGGYRSVTAKQNKKKQN